MTVKELPMPSRYLIIATVAFLTVLFCVGAYGGEMPSRRPEMKEDAIDGDPFSTPTGKHWI